MNNISKLRKASMDRIRVLGLSNGAFDMGLSKGVVSMSSYFKVK
ncbi:MAG: hypothetical protein WD426_04035 [Anditalea sp.]